MKLVKSVILIVLLAGIAGVLGLYSLSENLGAISTLFTDFYRKNSWLSIPLQVILLSLLVLLLFLWLRLIFKPISKRLILRQKKQGKMQFSIRTLETMTIASVQAIVPLNEGSIQARFFISKKERVKITLKLKADQPIQFLAEKSLQIEQQIVDSFNEMLQLEVTHIDIFWKAEKAAAKLVRVDSEISGI